LCLKTRFTGVGEIESSVSTVDNMDWTFIYFSGCKNQTSW